MKSFRAKIRHDSSGSESEDFEDSKFSSISISEISNRQK